MLNEVFKEIDFSFGLYEVSNFGRVKSLRKKNDFILKEFEHPKGYKMVGLKINGKYHTCYVHHLVAMAFLGFKSSKIINNDSLVVDHVDNDKNNNNISNLQIITHCNNITKNQKTKSIGVYHNGKKYHSYIFYKGEKHHLGTYNTFEEARNKHLLLRETVDKLRLS